MKRFLSYTIIIVAASFFTACTAASGPPTGAAQTAASSTYGWHDAAPLGKSQHLARAVCPQVVGKPTCLVLQRYRNGVTPLCSPSSCGWTPSQLQAAYNLTGALGNGSGTIVAVVDAFDEPDAASDLATYRSQFGLGTANFVKLNQSGQQYNYPESCAQASPGWCVEIDLDIEMVSASCPNCTIYLVESDGSISGFEAAEKVAVSLGATIVSNSWICYGSWDCGDSTGFPNAFNASGVEYVAASGDSGFDDLGGPSALSTVTSVGGTQLSANGSTYSETFWGSGGYGCASPDKVGKPGVPKPTWQKDPDCSYRTLVDVVAEAGCSPGVAEYDSNAGGWFGVCGTSVTAPFTAGVVGLAGNASLMDGAKTIWLLKKKQHKRYFHHLSGSDGNCGTYMCGDGRYKKYYSAPGGWGSPNGVKGY